MTHLETLQQVETLVYRAKEKLVNQEYHDAYMQLRESLDVLFRAIRRETHEYDKTTKVDRRVEGHPKPKSLN